MTDATTYGITSVDGSYTVLDRVPCDQREKCDRECFEDALCEEFVYNQATDTCSLFKAGCDHTGTGGASDICIIPSGNVKRSTGGLLCSHKAKYNADPDVRPKCNGLDNAACTASEYCDYNAWVPTFEKKPDASATNIDCGSTADALRLLKVTYRASSPDYLYTYKDGTSKSIGTTASGLTASAFTATACDSECFQTRDCSHFSLNAAATECTLYKAGCDFQEGQSAAGYSTYSTSTGVIYPSSNMNACTHKPIWNAHRDNRDECSAIKVETACTNNDKCSWVPWSASPLELTTCVPLTAPALIKTDWHCGDNGALKADSSPSAGFSTEATLADCAAKCAQDASCRWFDWTASSTRCELKKAGCVGAEKAGTRAYRPVGHTDAMCERYWYKILPGGSNPSA
jgi:hypothetical protein